MKAFLLIERHSVNFYPKFTDFRNDGLVCTVMANSAQEAAKIAGGKYDIINDGQDKREVVRFTKDMFVKKDYLLQMTSGPIRLYLERDADPEGTYLFLWELPQIFVPVRSA